MLNVSYPAVFHHENSSYWVEFPDLPGCFTQGSTLEEAYSFAKDALGTYLDTSEDIYTQDFKQPSSFEDITKEYPSETVMLVDFDSIIYAKHTKSRPVKKTLSIPEWLNNEANKHGINFSQVLQDALKEKLNLQ